jgi:hypothetical protein
MVVGRQCLGSGNPYLSLYLTLMVLVLVEVAAGDAESRSVF